MRPNFHLRPDNLSASIDAVRHDLRSLGLPAADLVFVSRALEAADENAARSLWNTDELRGRYRRRLDELAVSTKRLARVDARTGMVESFLIGGAALRDLVRDPLLPVEICAADERHSLLEAMKQYDRLGRAAWAEFLSTYDVPHLRGPDDPRPAVTPGLRSADPEGVRP